MKDNTLVTELVTTLNEDNFAFHPEYDSIKKYGGYWKHEGVNFTWEQVCEGTGCPVSSDLKKMLRLINSIKNKDLHHLALSKDQVLAFLPDINLSNMFTVMFLLVQKEESGFWKNWHLMAMM